jgi:hypothetical protein
MGNKLGLTQSTMRIIERRDITDAYLVFGGMIVTLLVPRCLVRGILNAIQTVLDHQSSTQYNLRQRAPSNTHKKNINAAVHWN